MEEIVKCFVEPPQATESGSHCNFRHWHPGFVDKLLREKHSTRLRDGNWGCAQMLEK
jgi:hypothetical protein